MIPAVTQTLAEILVRGTSLLSTEQIDLNHPSVQQNVNPRLNLYCYNIQENHCISVKPQLEHNLKSLGYELKVPIVSLRWFDISFLLSAWDVTSLGEQNLLSEALLILLNHDYLQEEVLAPTLRGYGELPMTVSSLNSKDAAALWNALGVPLRPAVYVTLTIPLNV